MKKTYFKNGISGGEWINESDPRRIKKLRLRLSPSPQFYRQICDRNLRHLAKMPDGERGLPDNASRVPGAANRGTDQRCNVTGAFAACTPDFNDLRAFFSPHSVSRSVSLGRPPCTLGSEHVQSHWLVSSQPEVVEKTRARDLVTSAISKMAELHAGLFELVRR